MRFWLASTKLSSSLSRVLIREYEDSAFPCISFPQQHDFTKCIQMNFSWNSHGKLPIHQYPLYNIFCKRKLNIKSSFFHWIALLGEKDENPYYGNRSVVYEYNIEFPKNVQTNRNSTVILIFTWRNLGSIPLHFHISLLHFFFYQVIKVSKM